MTRRFSLLAALLLAIALAAGCATLDEKQRGWIFQPSSLAWGNSASAAEGMDEVWIDFASIVTGQPARLNALWLAAEAPQGQAQGKAQGPVLLYLHGARWAVAGSAPRMRRMQELGFSVLAIDYRGFGKSSAGLPSEATAYEDARAAWDWLAQKYPDRPRYIYGHSLGGAIGIDLAAKVQDEQGTIVEGTFSSLPELASTLKWGWLQGGWLPLGPLITQRFDSISKVGRIGSPLLVVHGERDSLVSSTLARRLFDAAQGKKQFLLVEGGSHHSALMLGGAPYEQALAELFGLPLPQGDPGPQGLPAARQHASGAP